MEAIGSEVGQKMRSAIKAKLMELGCYVDDELPDYVMVMVANKRTRPQMEEDLALFLANNTSAFVGWLHQVLQKLQEVTVTKAAADLSNKKKAKAANLKKEKKDKAKKKQKIKSPLRPKFKKSKKEKTKKKETESIRPKVPPLLMNLEKDPPPSITDVFAGQILKQAGVLVEGPRRMLDRNRTRPPITSTSSITPSSPPVAAQPTLQEYNQINAKIQSLKQKLTMQLDSGSEDEDFISLRTEAEDLINMGDMGDLEPPIVAAPSPVKVVTPPVPAPAPPPPPASQRVAVQAPELPQIELQLPKRPMRERLGGSQPVNHVTPSRRISEKTSVSSRVESAVRSRLEDQRSGPYRSDSRIGSRVVCVGSPAVSLPSVVQAPPPPAPPPPQPASARPQHQLLMRAMADAHRDLLNKPPKQQMRQKALVLPMRRGPEPKKIIIEVSADSVGEYVPQPVYRPSQGSVAHVPEPYVPTHINTQTVRLDVSSVNRILNSGKRNADRSPESGPQFVVTLDGLDPNVFLEKKLVKEMQAEQMEKQEKHEKEEKQESKHADDKDGEESREKDERKQATEDVKQDTNEKKESESVQGDSLEIKKIVEKEEVKKCDVVDKKNRKSESKEEVKKNEGKVEIKKFDVIHEKNKNGKEPVKRNNVVVEKTKNIREETKRKVEEEVASPVLLAPLSAEVRSASGETVNPRKRKASPIIFNRKELETPKTEEKVLRTAKEQSKPNKYDAVPSLPDISKLSGSLTLPCRSFPQCPYGDKCVYSHPMCRFKGACTRRHCPYKHPAIASRVVTPSSYRSVHTGAPLATTPGVCRYFPQCANLACPWYHPKPCRFGPACLNKHTCNFYHQTVPSGPNLTY